MPSTSCLSCVAFSLDGKSLAFHYDDGTIAIGDISSDQIIARSSIKVPALAMAFNPDGKVLASGGAGSPLYLWDTAIPTR